MWRDILYLTACPGLRGTVGSASCCVCCTRARTRACAHTREEGTDHKLMQATKYHAEVLIRPRESWMMWKHFQKSGA